MDDLVSPYGTNSGHGHVWKRPDGVRVRCGGPPMCGACATDDAKYGWDALAARITALEAENARLTTDKAGLVEFIANPPKHRFWGAGEVDCPREIRCSNGELHTLRCKSCGLDSPPDQICRAALEQHGGGK